MGWLPSASVCVHLWPCFLETNTLQHPIPSFLHLLLAQAAIAMLSIQAPTDPQMALTTLRQLALHHRATLEPSL